MHKLNAGLRLVCLLALAACATTEPKLQVTEAVAAEPAQASSEQEEGEAGQDANVQTPPVEEAPPAQPVQDPPLEGPAPEEVLPAAPGTDPTEQRMRQELDMTDLVTADEVPDQPSTEVVVDYKDSPLEGATQRSIADEISIDLIDLEPFNAAIGGREERERIRLTLQESVQIALEGNPDILVSTYEPLMATADVEGSFGQFDPVLQGSAVYTYSSTSADPQLETFGGISAIESHRTVVSGTIAGRNRIGTEYSFGARFDKEESTFGSFIEEFSGLTTLTLTQPLLRGFGKTVNTVRIRQAENARSLTESQLKLSVMNSVAEVIRAYWELVGAIENVKVQEMALANAERLMDINQKRRDIGTAADIDVLQAKAGVATRQSDLIAARARVADAGDRLKYLLGLKDGEMFSLAQVIPLDKPNLTDTSVLDAANFEVEVEEAVQSALKNRPEVTMSELEIANAELEELRTRNEMLPELNLVGSYAQGGRDHKLREVFYGIRDEQDKIYSYGVEATIPLRNRAARYAHQRAQISTRQSEQRLQQTRQQLIMNVHIAGRNVLTNQALVESNRQARSMQEVNVIAEERKLRLGTTTSFQVLQVQEDLTLAQTQELQAQIAYEQALVDFQLAQGSLLENLGVEFEAPEAEPPVGYWRSITPRWDW